MPHSRIRRAAAALALSGAVLTAGALPVQAQNAVPEDEKPYIDRMIELMQFDTMVQQTMTGMTQQVLQAIRQNNPDMPEEAIQIVAQAFSEEGRVMMNGMMNELGPLMAKFYNAEELKQIVAFYETPAGQKSIQIIPQLTQEIQRLMQPRLQDFQQRAVAKAQERLKEAGYGS